MKRNRTSKPKPYVDTVMPEALQAQMYSTQAHNILNQIEQIYSDIRYFAVPAQKLTSSIHA